MSDLLMAIQFLLTFLSSADSQVEPYELSESCVHCSDFLKELGTVYHPFEHLSGDKPLDLFCRKVTGFINCIEHFDCFDPRAPPDFVLGGHSGWVFRGIVNVINVTDEICTNGTRLREDYLTHSQCFRSVHNRTNSVCGSRSVGAYLDYFDPKLKLYNPNDALQVERIDCVTAAVFIGCLGYAIHEECGDNALATFKEIIGLFGFFKMGRCSPETLHILRTSFMDSLRVDESRKSFYRECIV